METMRQRMVQEARVDPYTLTGKARNFDQYKLGVVKNGSETTQGVAFTDGQVVVGNPKPISICEDRYVGVFSPALKRHVSLPAEQVTFLL